MKKFTTDKGTVLYLLDIRGKPYLPAQERIIWFREEHPDWSIETEIVQMLSDSCCTKATIKDDKGRVIATSHKFEDKTGFPDFIEKSETSAIGRALALCGYGTQFTALEFDEGVRITDSPLNRPTKKEEATDDPPSSPEDYIIKIGKKFLGQRLGDVDQTELISFIDWIHDKGSAKFKKSQDTKDFLFYAEAHLENILDKPSVPPNVFSQHTQGI